MRTFKVFLFGLLYGWLIKIAFDRIYRENDMEDLRNENASLKDYIQTLEMQARTNRIERTPVQQPAAQAVPVEAPAEWEVTVEPGQTTPAKDDLKVIRGIGPAIEKRLNNAGIHTFAALAELKQAELESILGSQIKRLQDENNLIAQAKKLARQK
jgi:predicted flap endonuclease-1-like 5' DNA nuclease